MWKKYTSPVRYSVPAVLSFQSRDRSWSLIYWRQRHCQSFSICLLGSLGNKRPPSKKGSGHFPQVLKQAVNLSCFLFVLGRDFHRARFLEWSLVQGVHENEAGSELCSEGAQLFRNLQNHPLCPRIWREKKDLRNFQVILDCITRGDDINGVWGPGPAVKCGQLSFYITLKK